MKNIEIRRHYLFTLLALLAFSILNSSVSTARAQGTAFTYQGLLQDNGSPANGNYDLTLSLFNASSGGTQAGSTLTSTAVGVTNGLFVVTADFGSVFNGTPYWLQIGVRTNGASSFTALTSRQELTPTPYAVYAASAGSTALLSDTGTLNFFAGPNAGNSTLNGTDNTGIGYSALSAITSGNYNAAGGVAALEQDTTGSGNAAFGDDAMSFNSTGSDNAAFGADALAFNSTGTENTAMGYSALVLNTTGADNTAEGTHAIGGGGGVTTGTGDTGIGGYAIYELTTGYNNVGVGFQSLYANTSGFDNVGVGVATYQTNFTGYQNTAIGTYAFQHMTAGNGNVGIGYYAGNGLNAGSNNIYIGNPGAASDNNLIRIGNGQAETFIAGTKVGINNANPTTALDVGGEFITVEGATPVRAYIGDDGSGNDVQLGSLKSGITEVAFYNEADSAYMHINCSSITIQGGADLAEPFPFSNAKQKISAGEVVVIDEENPGQLKLTDQPYDTRVAGVVSGANGINPGIQMHQQGLLDGGRNVALTGRVYVQADTSNGAIKPGDLLTTSSTPGRAMKVSDHVRAQGAILGKAMTALHEGQGMVLVLVTLQ